MRWIFALLSAVFAALTSILAKVGIEDVDSTLSTAIRTVAVVGMSWLMVFITNTQSGISSISKKSWIFLILSGLATGASWLCYYKAIQMGDVSKVVPIDKLFYLHSYLLLYSCTKNLMLSRLSVQFSSRREHFLWFYKPYKTVQYIKK